MLRNFLWRPRRKWQQIDDRIQMLHSPDLSAKYFPDADAVFATAWFTAFDINDLPPNKGEKFYLIQHYETWMGPKDLVDKTWLMPLHKVTYRLAHTNVEIRMRARDRVEVFRHSIEEHAPDLPSGPRNQDLGCRWHSRHQG